MAAGMKLALTVERRAILGPGDAAGGYLADASDLGLAVGAWPEIIILRYPSGESKVFEAPQWRGHDDRVEYRTATGEVLTIRND